MAVTVKIVYKPVGHLSKETLPRYETIGSAGMDVKANTEEIYELWSGQTMLIPTGLYVEIPIGYEIQVRPRGGLAIKNGVTVLNTPGTIDSDYRGEIGVILINHGHECFSILPGMRIAQLVLTTVSQIKWQEVGELRPTDRGEGAYGSTGVSDS